MNFVEYNAKPDQADALPIYIIYKSKWDESYKSFDTIAKNWISSQCTKVDAGQCFLCPDGDGKPHQVIACVEDNTPALWLISHLPSKLPEGNYYLVDQLAPESLIGWSLEQYSFDHYVGGNGAKARVLLHPVEAEINAVISKTNAHNLARDLINSPTNDMGPSHLADAAKQMAKSHGAKCEVTTGEALLKQNYPVIHAVGRAAENEPRLIDIRWGKKDAPKLTLVGKGVCFDTGGLDIKPYSSMKMMKKDMGGGAFVLALADMIMSLALPVCLRVLVPAVENSISDNAFRPQDILTARDGTTIEIGSTDAEGRLILADALVEADSEKPDFILDVATLTGAARVALGTHVPALFSKNQGDAGELVDLSIADGDPLWQLPLWDEYREFIKSPVADTTNTPTSSFGGAIHAALFLEHFVKQTENWMHIDTMGWNLTSRPGRPKGGEALGLHAVYAWLEKRYKS